MCKSYNKQLKPTSTALLVLCFFATLAQNNQLRSGGLAGRYIPKKNFTPLPNRALWQFYLQALYLPMASNLATPLCNTL